MRTLTSRSRSGAYDAYLVSDTWRARRKAWYAAWLTRCGTPPACLVCDQEWNLRSGHLHHLTYERLGHEDDEDLVPLCAAPPAAAPCAGGVGRVAPAGTPSASAGIIGLLRRDDLRRGRSANSGRAARDRPQPCSSTWTRSRRPSVRWRGLCICRRSRRRSGADLGRAAWVVRTWSSGSASNRGSYRPAGSSTTAWSRRSALRDHERACYAASASPTAAVDWFRALREIEIRLADLAAQTQCTVHEHRPTPVQEWATRRPLHDAAREESSHV